MNDVVRESFPKRQTAFKFRVGSILAGTPVFEGDKLKHINIDGRPVLRVNLIANVIEKFVQEGEKAFGSLSLDDATGQIKVKVFGDDVAKIENFNQGDTLVVIGLLRFWNTEIYLTPEIVKKKDPQFLLVRKLEIEKMMPKTLHRESVAALKDSILQRVKDAEKDGGVEIEKLILELKEPPEIINREIRTLLEDGVAYEPRPGKLRYLG